MESRIDNPNFVKEQYKNGDNLNARISLHQFNRNKRDWHNWFFEKMDIPHHSKILELGCGTGILWVNNKEALNETLSITLSDFSEGMLESAKENINDESIKYEIIDIQDIPYEDESFDIIISRHMLYHVPDIHKALSEVKRVLKKGGKFYVSTNGKEHMAELESLVKGYDENISFDLQIFPNKFGIENGEEYLKKHFNNVVFEEFRGEIATDKIDPLVGYIMTFGSPRKAIVEAGKLEAFNSYVQGEIDKTGEFRITTRCGIFTVSKS